MKIFIIISLIVFLIINYIFVFSLAKASSNLHRMEERWEYERDQELD